MGLRDASVEDGQPARAAEDKAGHRREPGTARCPHAIQDESNGSLVRKAGKGDDQAWAELIRRFGPMVARVARRTGLSEADAADVQQTTWIALMRYADQIRDPERIGSWLATSARRQSQRVAMARSCQTLSADPVADARWTVGETDGVEALIMRDQFDATLERAVSRLPLPYQTLLRLLSSDACPSYADVAQAMRLPVGSIGPMRQRGLLMLRRDAELPHLNPLSGGPAK
jgi:RNA polymerase sigma factor (sigma-70 family)